MATPRKGNTPDYSKARDRSTVESMNQGSDCDGLFSFLFELIIDAQLWLKSNSVVTTDLGISWSRFNGSS